MTGSLGNAKEFVVAKIHGVKRPLWNSIKPKIGLNTRTSKEQID